MKHTLDVGRIYFNEDETSLTVSLTRNGTGLVFRVSDYNDWTGNEEQFDFNVDDLEVIEELKDMLCEVIKNYKKRVKD